MKNIVFRASARALTGALLLACGAAALPARAANVGVSVNVGQPGFYGRIDIGNQPPPVVVYPQPVVIAPAPYAVVQRPIYLRVPPGHERNWGRYCGRYNACGQPVYFVQEGWYREQYAPHYAPQYAPQYAPHDAAPQYAPRGGPRHAPPPEREYEHGRGRGHGDDRGRNHGQGRGDRGH